MKEKEINVLVDRFLRGKIANDDFQLLLGELKSPNNKKIIEELIEVSAFTGQKKKADLDVLKAYSEVSKKLGLSNKKRSLGYRISKYAAVFVGLVGIAYYFQVLYTNDSDLLIENYENSITLQLENGNIEVISETGEKKVIDKKGNVVGTQSGDVLSYQKDAELEKLVYNELKIPNGKTFELELSDGTHIHLNAGTSLKYPINFIEGKDRRVFLVGEAYFDVAKDAKHPFIVSTNEMDVRVLGTEFNVSSYKELSDVNTVLVEGSVAIYKDGDSYDEKTAILLTPGHKATWDNDTDSVSIKKVDTREYTAWIDGKMIFKKRPFEEIVQVLGRHFDVEIVNNYEHLNSQRFLASFDSESIEQILEYFKKSTDFDYTHENDKIIINKPKL